MSTDESPSGEFHVRFEREMSAREQARIQLAERQVDAFVEVFMRRYGLTEEEMPKLIEAIRWAAQFKANLAKLAIAGLVALIGLIIGGLGALLVEGMRHYLGMEGGS